MFEQPPHCEQLRLSLTTGRFVHNRWTLSQRSSSGDGLLKFFHFCCRTVWNRTVQLRHLPSRNHQSPATGLSNYAFVPKISRVCQPDCPTTKRLYAPKRVNGGSNRNSLRRQSPATGLSNYGLVYTAKRRVNGGSNCNSLDVQEG